MFSRVGIPSEMLVDHNSKITVEVMSEVSRLLSLQKLTTIPYSLYSKGPVEKFHSMMKQMLQTMCAERRNDCDKYLPALLFALREIPQESLGFSPFELLYGRNVRGPMQILKELWSVEEHDERVLLTYQYVIELRQRLEQTCKLAQDSVRKLDIKQKVFYDKRTKSRKFDVEDNVLLLLPNESNKLLLQWDGPYEVVEVVNVMFYKINVKGIVNTYPTNMMKQYVERRNVTSQSAIVESRYNVNFEDHGNPHDDRIKLDRVTPRNVPEGDPTCGDVTSMKSNQLFEHVPERKTKSEATDLDRAVTQNRGNVKQDVKMTSDVIHRVTQKVLSFTRCSILLTSISPFRLRRGRYSTESCWISG